MKEFKIPEKWAIRPSNQEEGDIVCEYINKFKSTPKYTPNEAISYYWHFPSYNLGEFCWIYTYRAGYTEITFSQFKQYVLKEEVEIEDYRCIVTILDKLNIV